LYVLYLNGYRFFAGQISLRWRVGKSLEAFPSSQITVEQRVASESIAIARGDEPHVSGSYGRKMVAS